jgi:hypothetical protein
MRMGIRHRGVSLALRLVMRLAVWGRHTAMPVLTSLTDLRQRDGSARRVQAHDKQCDAEQPVTLDRHLANGTRLRAA